MADHRGLKLLRRARFEKKERSIFSWVQVTRRREWKRGYEMERHC